MVNKGSKVSGLIKGLAHAGYTTGTLETTVEFYCGALGIENSRQQVSDQPYLSEVTGHKNCRLKIGFIQPEGARLPFEIIEYMNPKGGKINTDFDAVGTAHLSWETDNIQAAYKRLSEKGVEFLTEPMELNYGFWRKAKGVFFRDPSGLLNQLIEVNADANGKGRILRMHHVSCLVSNLDAAMDYFCRALGLEPAGRMQNDSKLVRESGRLETSIFESSYVKLPESDFVIELWSLKASKPLPGKISSSMVGNVHLCFMVEDMKDSYHEISSRGLRFVGPPVEITAGVNKGAYAIYMEGMDGIICEIFQGPPTKVG